MIFIVLKSGGLNMDKESGYMRRQHGVWSLVLVFVAIMIGAVSIKQSSIFIALVYIGLSLVSLVIVIYSFCSKCPCRHDCGHVLPGKLTELLPKRVQGPYEKLDYFGVSLPFLFIIGFPQFWLVAQLQLIVTFWVLLIIAVIEITKKVCKGCGNKLCPFNSRLN